VETAPQPRRAAPVLVAAVRESVEIADFTLFTRKRAPRYAGVSPNDPPAVHVLAALCYSCSTELSLSWGKRRQEVAAVDFLCDTCPARSPPAGDQTGHIRVWDLTANACSCELVPEIGTAGDR
jgi:hypothetical protein